MIVKHSGAVKSSIVSIGVKLKKLAAETGKEYLMINRGINAVVNIDLREVVKKIDFNSPKLQTYPPSQGLPELREAINQEYFMGKSDKDNILMTAGGMNALDLTVQSLEVERVYLPRFCWGSYFQILKVRGKESGEYESHDKLYDMLDELRGNAVILGDPGNPFGEKYDDDKLFDLVKTLNDADVTVIFDSPYRRVFHDNSDDYYTRLMTLENVIISESFSKSVGLSGQRLGFVHSSNAELISEMALRLDLTCNGVNAFAQLLVHALLTTDEGRKAVTDFKKATTDGIRRNIEYLQKHNLVADNFYQTCSPTGIFVVVNKTQEELEAARIGSVTLAFFTKNYKEEGSKYARICVSTPHDKFVEFFDNMLN